MEQVPTTTNNNNNDDEPGKWKGLVTAKLPASIEADQAWSLLGDFCGISKFLPYVNTCQMVEGTDGEPGCVRYCALSPDPAGSVSWAKEKLTEMDGAKRRYSYEITESNMGFGSYLATLSVVEDEEGGCTIEWLFELDPIQRWTRSGFTAFMEAGVNQMAARIQEALNNNIPADEI